MKILLVNPQSPQDNGRDLYMASIAGSLYSTKIVLFIAFKTIR